MIYFIVMGMREANIYLITSIILAQLLRGTDSWFAAPMAHREFLLASPIYAPHLTTLASLGDGDLNHTLFGLQFSIFPFKNQIPHCLIKHACKFKRIPPTFIKIWPNVASHGIAHNCWSNGIWITHCSVSTSRTKYLQSWVIRLQPSSDIIWQVKYATHLKIRIL